MNLLLFFIMFKSDMTHAYVARTFYIWVSVFNLFVVSVFWSFMADIFTNEQAKRLFAFIAAGGTTGALIGPLLTTTLVGSLGPTNLLLFSAGLLGCAVLCIKQLAGWQLQQMQSVPAASGATQKIQTAEEEQGLQSGIWAGVQLLVRSPYLMGICVLILLYTTLSTFLYFQQAQIIRDSFNDSSTRTAVFAGMDLSVNALTIIFQVFLTARIVKVAGIAWTLSIIPLVLVPGFLCLGFAPILMVIVILQVVRRAGNYAIMRPAREMLYVVVSKDEKYKTKNFIDTAVYRGGDVVSAWVYTGFRGLGLSLAAIALIAVPVAGIWGWVAFTLGKKQEELALQHTQ
jgi:AAA family ATP:ADP antiporter